MTSGLQATRRTTNDTPKRTEQVYHRAYSLVFRDKMRSGLAMEFHHHAIAVRDLERSESFYLELLQLPLIRRHHDEQGRHRATWLECAPGFLALERMDGRPATPSSDLRHHCFVLRIPPEKRTQMLDRLRMAGYPREKSTDFTFYVRDPDGALVGFSHHPDPAICP